MTPQDDSTPGEKFLVCLTSFGFSCAAFVVAATCLLPIVATVCQKFAVPDAVTKVVILVTLFGTPVIAALWGLKVAAKPIVERQLARQDT